MQTMHHPCGTTSPQDSSDSDSDSDSDYSNGSCSDEADHDEERAARKIHLLLNEKWQDIVMDRAAWKKMLRNICTN
jgi:hypothetical protein